MKPDDPPAKDGPDTLVTAGAPRTGPTEYVEDPTKTSTPYAYGEVIGRGGVGEVVLAHDRRINRDVAIKRLHSASPTEDEIARFMREARIQARLDHPAIVPVHELGRDADGRPYFTMKRLSGMSLSETLSGPTPQRERLLRAFADVCLAIEFAHSRGIVHRDLKPANIMLGDFGEVYVIDWGLARVVGEGSPSLVSDDIDSLDEVSGDAQVLGTPGYMAPEQMSRALEVGRAADVYALGSIAFEILAGESLHPRGEKALASTIGGDTIASPAKRRPERAIPPELDSLCTGMLAMDPTARPTARKVAERVNAYLDGDRDVARRRTMAVDLVWSARAALNDGRRAEAMRAAGRALALDPESPGAAELITALVLEPPVEQPPDLVRVLHDVDAEHSRKHARTAIFAYLAIASFLPIAAWNGIRNWNAVLAVFAAAVTMAIAAWRITRHPDRSFVEMMFYAFGNAVVIALMTRMAGPFNFVPALSCVMVMSVMAYPTFIVRSGILIATLAIGFLGPIALEKLGYLPATFEIRSGELVSHAGALELRGTPTLVMLILASSALLVVAGIDAARIYRSSRNAQRQLVTQAWHLQQLLPATTRATTAMG